MNAMNKLNLVKKIKIDVGFICYLKKITYQPNLKDQIEQTKMIKNRTNYYRNIL